MNEKAKEQSELESLRAANRLLQALIDNVPNPLWIKNADC